MKRVRSIVTALALVMAALFAAVAILPDERLIRTKLLVLESGVFAASLEWLLLHRRLAWPARFVLFVQKVF